MRKLGGSHRHRSMTASPLSALVMQTERPKGTYQIKSNHEKLDRKNAIFMIN